LRRRQIKPMGAERGSRKVGKAKRMKSSRHAVHSSYGRGTLPTLIEMQNL